MLFDVVAAEQGGRSGILNIGGFEIKTPTNFLTQTDITSIKKFYPITRTAFSPLRNLGVQVNWITKDLTVQLRDDSKFEYFKEALNNKILDESVNTRIIHFEFPRSITSLNQMTLEKLLKAQVESNAQVLEIPNFFNNQNYSQALISGIKYFKRYGGGRPIMAVACKKSDFDLINKKMNWIDCVGVNLREQRVIKRLLYGVRDLLRKNKKKKVWVHSFSTPRSYKLIERDGTPGIGINRFGIDTISFPVKLGRGAPSKKTAMERHRYYNPTDYGTYPWGFMAELNEGRDLYLSDYCECPFCGRYTMIDIIENYSQEPYFTRAHEAVAYNRESQKLRELINDPRESALQYIESKYYAYEFFSKLV
jgi:hypothetical protein